MGRFADFDASFEQQDPLEVKLFGEVWELPAEMPAVVMLKIARWAAHGRESSTLTSGELLDLAADLIPADTLTAWTSRPEGLSSDRLGQILAWVMRCYMGSADPGEAPAPEEGATGEPTASPPSSTTGG